jgi:ribose 5-phosphate isomerase B
MEKLPGLCYTPVIGKERKDFMKIAIGNDHAAVEMKKELQAFVAGLGHEVVNFGTDTEESVNYPVYGEKVAQAVAKGEVDRGIAICGTGVGISLAANKVRGIRAVVCSEPYSAVLSRQHNNTNVLALGARVVGIELAKMIVKEWLEAEFEGGRHAERVAMIMDIEEKKG